MPQSHNNLTEENYQWIKYKMYSLGSPARFIVETQEKRITFQLFYTHSLGGGDFGRCWIDPNDATGNSYIIHIATKHKSKVENFGVAIHEFTHVSHFISSLHALSFIKTYAYMEKLGYDLATTPISEVETKFHHKLFSEQDAAWAELLTIIREDSPKSARAYFRHHVEYFPNVTKHEIIKKATKFGCSRTNIERFLNK